MIEGEEIHKAIVVFFKTSGKMYASGPILLPDHWEVCGGPVEQLLAWIAPRQQIIRPEAVLEREFNMVIVTHPDTDANANVRYLYPRMVPAKEASKP